MPDASFAKFDAPVAARSLGQLQRDCEEVARTRPGDTHTMASLLLQMSVRYYQDVLRQAMQSFYCALGAAVIGTLFFIYAAAVGMGSGSASNGYVSLVAGALIQVISAINFWLYGRATRQFASFHICLERTNRFLLANTLCENLDSTGPKDEMRAELIRVVANAPMLTLEMMGGEPQAREPTQSQPRAKQSEPTSPASLA